MRWSDLAFLHWPIDPAQIRPMIPDVLEIDTFEDRAWLGIVPFRMEEVHLRFAPPIPTANAFPELNVRTYVRAGTRRGVWFFSLDAASSVAVRGARLMYNLPYFDAEMSVERHGERIEYRSQRVHGGAPPARLHAIYEPVGPVSLAEEGTLDHFLVERYCLFNVQHSGAAGYIDIHHQRWPLQPATADIGVNTMATAAGITLPETPPLVHFARTIEVLVWTHENLADG
jgi:uncharacterized protein YqjF (DUF2071 family)